MAAHRSQSHRVSSLGAGRSGRRSTGSGRRARARVWSMAFRWAIVTSHASTLLPGRSVGYARNAARNVSDHASSASIGPRTARHTRSTVGPWLVTISSKGGRVVLTSLVNVLAPPNVRSSRRNHPSCRGRREGRPRPAEQARYSAQEQLGIEGVRAGTLHARTPGPLGVGNQAELLQHGHSVVDAKFLRDQAILHPQHGGSSEVHLLARALWEGTDG